LAVGPSGSACLGRRDLADTTAKGMREAAGLMVHYVYRIEEIDANHEAYTGDKTIPASRAVYELLKPGR
jgi:malonyl-CoA decarboxylase